MRPGALALFVFLATWAQPPDGQAEAGQKVFARYCGLCHGLDGKGGKGPALTRPVLRHAPDDEALRALIVNGIEPEMPRVWYLAPRDLADLVAFVRALGRAPAEPVAGDPRRGETIYGAQGCAGCHTVNGQGSGFGPELSDIGVRRGAAYLHQAVTEPEATFPENFLWVEAGDGGPLIRGVRVNEDSFTIQLKEASGQYHSLRKEHLRTLRKQRGRSPMPAYRLPSGDLDHLVAYLVSLRGRL